MASPLNKTETRRQQRREREEDEREIAALEPIFPFLVIQFEPEFFGITANPPDFLEQEDSPQGA